MNNLFRIKEFYFVLYILIINLCGMVIMAVDKYKAKKDRWRIKERSFFIISLLGGAAGVMMGMTIFRHKTQHKSFYLGIPVIYMVNVIFFCWLFYKMYLS